MDLSDVVLDSGFEHLLTFGLVMHDGVDVVSDFFTVVLGDLRGTKVRFFFFGVLSSTEVVSESVSAVSFIWSNFSVLATFAFGSYSSSEYRGIDIKSQKRLQLFLEYTSFLVQ